MITKVERERVFNVMRSLGLALWHEVCTVDLLMQVMLLTTHSVPRISLCACLRFLFLAYRCQSITVQIVLC